MKRRFILISVLILCLAAPVSAIDIDYSGPVDSYTNKPLSTSPEPLPAESRSGIVQLKGSLNVSEYYDYDQELFLYKLSSGAEIVSSVANGISTTDAVEIAIPEIVSATVYCDGTPLEDISETMILRDPGSYVIDVRDGSNFIQPLKFTILNYTTGVLNEFTLPDKFLINSVTLDGVDMNFSPYSADLLQEGHYQIGYYCTVTNERYNLEIQVDHTAPVLALAEVVDGVAKGPVSLADAEDHSILYIEHDGQPMSRRYTLNESGEYTVTIKDEAGNSNVYKFVIQVYFNLSSILLLACLLLVGVGILAFMLRTRRNLRVR